MPSRFNISRNGHGLGSFSKEQLTQRLQANELYPTDAVLVPETGAWLELSTFLSTPKAALAPPPPTSESDAPIASSLRTSAQSAVPLKVPPGAKPVVEAKRGKVSLKGGVGTIELLRYSAGTLNLAVIGDSLKNMEFEAPKELQIKSAQASKLVIKTPNEIVAGAEALLIVEAHDKWGNCDGDFIGVVGVELSNGIDIGIVQLSNGQGKATFTVTKAGAVSVKLTDVSRTGLDVTAMSEFKCVPGPAAKLVIVSPEQTMAGHPVRVHVKALDQYGNLASACNDEVEVEVSAKSNEPTTSRSPQAS